MTRPLPDLAVGNVWIYDVVVRRRSRPQDESRPWSEWSTARLERRAIGMEAVALDGVEYVVVEEVDQPIDPPGEVSTRPGVPHRRDRSGLYRRPTGIIGTSASSRPVVAERSGGTTDSDELLVPQPAIPGREFASSAVLGEIRLVEAHGAVLTGLGRIPAARVRSVSGKDLAPTDLVVDWFAPQGRVASLERRTRIGFGPGSGPNRERLWIEVETASTLRAITASSN